MGGPLVDAVSDAITSAQTQIDMMIRTARSEETVRDEHRKFFRCGRRRVEDLDHTRRVRLTARPHPRALTTANSHPVD